MKITWFRKKERVNEIHGTTFLSKLPSNKNNGYFIRLYVCMMCRGNVFLVTNLICPISNTSAEADPGEGLRGLQPPPPFENFFFVILILPDSSQNNNRIKLFLRSCFTCTIRLFVKL